MLKSERFSRPEPTPDNEILKLSEGDYLMVRDYCAVRSTIIDQTINIFIYTGIVKLLASLPLDKDGLRVVRRLLWEAAEAFVAYSEVLGGDYEG